MSIASGAHLSITRKGAIVLDQNKVTDILYVPGVTKNLIFVGKIKDVRYLVLFGSTYCIVFDKDDTSRILLWGCRDPHSKLYYFDPGVCQSTPVQAAILSLLVEDPVEVDSAASVNFPSRQLDTPATPSIQPTSSMDTPTLWHRRLNHANFQLAHYVFLGFGAWSTFHSTC